MDIYSESTLAILVGLTGMLSGLAVKKISNFRHFQDILIAVAINAGFAFLISIYKYGDTYYASRVMTSSSVFLVVGMIIFATVVRPKQIIKSQSIDVIMPNLGQSLDFTGKVMWFYQIWWTAFTKPKEANYLELAENKKASWQKAYWWVFVSGFSGGVLGFAMGEGVDLTTLTFGIVLGILSLIGLVIESLVIHVVAQVEGGTGSYSSLLYLLSAINAPVMGINSFLVTLSIFKASNDPSAWLIGLTIFISLVLVYTAILGIIVTKSINKFTLLRSIIAAIPYRVLLIVVVIVLSIYLSTTI